MPDLRKLTTGYHKYYAGAMVVDADYWKERLGIKKKMSWFGRLRQLINTGGWDDRWIR